MTTIPRLRIASEMHLAPGWVALVPDDGRVGYKTDVVLYVTPRPDSFKLAQHLVEAVNSAFHTTKGTP